MHTGTTGFEADFDAVAAGTAEGAEEVRAVHHPSERPNNTVQTIYAWMRSLKSV